MDDLVLLTHNNIETDTLWDLGTFNPDVDDWKAYLQSYLNPRYFHYRWVMPPTTWGNNFGWHRDCNDDADFWIATWANRYTTLISPSIDSPNVYRAKPGQVLLLKNTAWLHKAPRLSKAQTKERLFARAYIFRKSTNKYIRDSFPEDY